jgi:DNA invertase Pin-like site-specific DNA recombinase
VIEPDQRVCGCCAANKPTPCLTILAGFAQFEREMMLERQREGIAKARAENRYLGRRPSARLKTDEAVKLFKAGRTVTQIANDLGIGRGSVYRALETRGIKQAASGVSADRGI